MNITVLMFLGVVAVICASFPQTIKITTFYGYGCDWPHQWRNYSLPVCWLYRQLRITRIEQDQILWERYQDPEDCTSYTGNSTWVPLNTCTNQATVQEFYRAEHPDQLPTAVAVPEVEVNITMPLNATIFFFPYNTFCNGGPAKKEFLSLNKCLAGEEGNVAYMYKGWRMDGSDPVLVAEYWDSWQSCDGVNRGWAYLRNGRCSAIDYPSNYHSWIAYW